MDGCTDDRRPAADVNDRIMLHGDNVRCVYGHGPLDKLEGCGTAVFLQSLTNRLTDERLPAAAYMHLLVTSRRW